MVDSLVPLAVDIGGLLLKEEGMVGRQIGYVLDPFQEEEDDVLVRVLDDTAVVYMGDILYLGQTADQAIMVGKGHCCTHTWAELVVVQNGNVDFADSAPMLAFDWCSILRQGVELVAGIDSVAGVTR